MVEYQSEDSARSWCLKHDDKLSHRLMLASTMCSVTEMKDCQSRWPTQKAWQWPVAETKKLLRPAVWQRLQQPDWGGLAKTLRWLLADPNRQLVAYDDNSYPSSLRQLTMPPPWLWLEGRLSLIAKPAVTIVGARQASPYHMKIANELSQCAAQCQLVVISGLAKGIDRAAHQGAEHGSTIVVQGCGLPICYPKQHVAYKQHLLQQDNLILSAYCPWQAPKKRFFLERNHLMAALGLATIVVVAGERSGSLVTARVAAELGREVLVCPPSWQDRSSRGNYQLLTDGATIMQSIDDFFQLIRQLSPATKSLINLPDIKFVDDKDHKHLWKNWAIGEKISFAELKQRTGYSDAKLNNMLLYWQFDDRIFQQGIFFYRRQ